MGERADYTTPQGGEREKRGRGGMLARTYAES